MSRYVLSNVLFLKLQIARRQYVKVQYLSYVFIILLSFSLTYKDSAGFQTFLNNFTKSLLMEAFVNNFVYNLCQLFTSFRYFRSVFFKKRHMITKFLSKHPYSSNSVTSGQCRQQLTEIQNSSQKYLNRIRKMNCTILFIYIKKAMNLLEYRQKAYLPHTKFW